MGASSPASINPVIFFKGRVAVLTGVPGSYFYLVGSSNDLPAGGFSLGGIGIGRDSLLSCLADWMEELRARELHMCHSLGHASRVTWEGAGRLCLTPRHALHSLYV